MTRTCLIWLLSLALISVGASGLHGHLAVHEAHDPSEHAGTVEHTPSEARSQVITVFDADHFRVHEHHGDIDINPVEKAFGKVPLAKVSVALLFVCGLVWTIAARQRVFRMGLPPLRPPKVRFRPQLLPPSQAPPRAA
jgi:hypothetical protein